MAKIGMGLGLLLLVATEAGAQCAPTTSAALLAATAFDPTDWGRIMQYATKRKFDTTRPTDLIYCGGTAPMFAGSFPSLHPTKAPAYFSYEPKGGDLNRTHLLYRKNSHTELDVSVIYSVRVRLASDGTTVARVYALDIAGHRLPDRGGL